MGKNVLDIFETLKYKLRLAARILAFSILLASIVFIFRRPSVGLYDWIFGLIAVMIAWRLPWLGGLLMIPVAVLGFEMLPLGNWDYWTKLPFIVFLYAFIGDAILFIMSSVSGWVSRTEWPLKRRA